jgi:hypothetical protein
MSERSEQVHLITQELMKFEGQTPRQMLILNNAVRLSNLREMSEAGSWSAWWMHKLAKPLLAVPPGMRGLV